MRSGDGAPLQAHVAPWRAESCSYNRKVKDAESRYAHRRPFGSPMLELTGEEQSAPALTTASIVVVIDEFGHDDDRGQEG